MVQMQHHNIWCNVTDVWRLYYSKEYVLSLPELSSISVKFRSRCIKGNVLAGLQMEL